MRCQRPCPSKISPFARRLTEAARRETEYRIEGNPGLVFVVQRPDKNGASTKTWRAYYSRVEDGRQIKRKLRLGKYPAVSLAQARRLAAEVAEAVEKGRDPVAEEHAQRAQRERNGLTLADLIAEYVEDQRRSGVATVREIERALKRDIVPTLGHFRPADDHRLADRGRHRRRRGARQRDGPASVGLPARRLQSRAPGLSSASAPIWPHPQSRRQCWSWTPREARQVR